MERRWVRADKKKASIFLMHLKSLPKGVNGEETEELSRG